MAYPGRPAMVPGIPLPSPMGIGAYMPPMLPSVMAMPPMMPMRPFRPKNNSHKMYSEPPRRGPAEPGPTITVFIGNIVEHAPDLMIKHILSNCGQVVSWKRTEGFGFCEFGSPGSALRAIRVLQDMQIGAKKLVVKYDANTTVKLNDYKIAQRKLQGKPDIPAGAAGDAELEDFIDEQTRLLDRRCQSIIFQIIDEFQEEMENALLEKKEEIQFNKEIIQNLPDPNRAQRSQDILSKLTRDAAEKGGVVKDDLEDGKRELITREIGKFREIMKKQEAEREEERLRREQERSEKGRSRSRSRSVSTVRSVRSVRSHRSPSVSKASTPEPRHKTKNRRVRSHSRSRDRDREREREREQSSKPRQSKRDLDRAAARELEEEEEAKERKKLDKKTREKEVVYQERVRMWESRERRKRKEFEKDKDRKLLREDDMAREAKKLKEFLEDYDDERDDSKFYKGRELQRRMTDRERERESDDKDRMREKEEIEELRNKVLESEHSDPTGVYEQLLQEHENKYKPKIIIDVNAEQMVRQREREKEREKEREAEMKVLEEEKSRKEAELLALGSEKPAQQDSPSDDDDDRGADFGTVSNNNSPSDNEDTSKLNSHSAVPGKKKKLDVKDVFNADEDEDSAQGAKRRKLVPLDYDEKEKGSTRDKDSKKKDHHRKDDKKGDENSKSTEEKRKHVKSLIDKIPTDKSALFEYTIDWTMVDNILMEKRIRPWINKKIIEYIGEPEPTLVDFICSKVLAGSQPQGILDDVQMVLDEEAEIFVVKMWRLLIYEIEAKKMGFVK